MHRFFIIMIVALFSIIWCSGGLFAKESSTVKFACGSAFRKSADDMRMELLNRAKRLAIEEIFGERIRAFSNVQDFSLKKDVIESHSGGFIRIQGNPQYYQGKNWGEVCVKINAYAAQEDFNQFKPRKRTKKECVMEGDVSIINELAENKAKLKTLIDYDGNLKNYPPEQVLPLLHEAKFTEAGFVGGTSTYCVKVEGIVYPVEVQAFARRGHDKSTNQAKLMEKSVSDSSNQKASMEPDRAEMVSKLNTIIQKAFDEKWRLSGKYTDKNSRKRGFRLTIDKLDRKTGKFYAEFYDVMGMKAHKFKGIISQDILIMESSKGSKFYLKPQELEDKLIGTWKSYDDNVNREIFIQHRKVN